MSEPVESCSKSLRDISDIIEALREELFLGSRAKKVSQLIVESWLPRGEEYKKIFDSNDSDEIKKLFLKEGIFDDKKDADSFETIEIETIKVQEKDGNCQYLGSLELRKTLEPKEIKFKLTIPYPPKPDIKDEVLEQWVDNNNALELEPPHYIPHSTT